MNSNRLGGVLIYRLGSLGDTVVALPALRLVARAYPDVQRYLLTNFNMSAKAAPVAAVLDGTGLVHGYLEYPIGLRNPLKLFRLLRQIRAMHFDSLVYLTEARNSIWSTLRDAAFFRLCGIRRLIGIPYSSDERHCRKLDNNIYEYEGARLLRCIHELGSMDLHDPVAFDLSLNPEERRAADRALAAVMNGSPMLGISIGVKADVKDWGDENWRRLLPRLSERLRGWSLAMLGSADEWGRSEELLQHWSARSLNLCGKLSVRQSAAVLEHSTLFVGHDSGPMHLAAAVGIPCVAIFSARSLPGVWFPYGQQHKVLYPNVVCDEYRQDVRERLTGRLVRKITVEQVVAAVDQLVSQVVVQPRRIRHRL